jgi:hypothetical protein
MRELNEGATAGQAGREAARQLARIVAASLLVVASACDAKPAEDAAGPAVRSANAGPDEKKNGPVDISSAKADPDTWMLLTVEELGFEARFPVAPKKQDMSMPTPAGTIPAMMYMAEQGSEAVGVTVISVPEAILGQFNVDGGLDGARDGMINNVGGTIVSEQQLQFLGHEARAIVGKADERGTPMKIEARLFWVSPRMYQLIAVSVDGAASNPADAFFANFRLLE